jgi:uncharacterized membrane protein
MPEEKQADQTETEPGAAKAQRIPGTEPVWTYRGYQLRPSEFTTAMVHFFRAEIQRANVWRQRLDTTTNWAVITTAAAISLAFSRTIAEDHRVIILNVLLVTLFLWIEARRDRYYELWSYRVRLMETDFFATMLVPPFHPASDWAESLADSLLHPQLPISMWEALGRRYRRNYMWIYFILALAWLSKVWLHPTLAASWLEVFTRAGIGSLPGEMVLAVGLVFNGLLMAIGLLTIGLQEASGEVLPRYPVFLPSGSASRLRTTIGRVAEPSAWFRPSRRRQQLVAYIVTDRAEAVAQRILKELRRGVTSLSGIGMYTHEARPVLMCALTVTEVAHIKAIVNAEDSRAFVIVSPAQEVLGSGFSPLRESGDSA